jgi:hypothetical protein
MQDAIVKYMYRSGWVYHSVELVRPDLHRWERQLRSWGVTAIPPLPSRSWSHADSRAHNLLNLLMRQASRKRDQSSEHYLRKLSPEVRPYKP